VGLRKNKNNIGRNGLLTNWKTISRLSSQKNGWIT